MEPHCPPPRGFKPARTITWAHLRPGPPSFIKRKRPRGRKALGVRYERKVLDHLETSASLPLLRSPWIEFGELEQGRPRWCQPDGLLLDPWEGRIVLLEVKYQHTADAWWQLTQLYSPVLQKLLPQWDICKVEVVKWFDPATSFPEKPLLLPDPVDAGRDGIHVHILKP